MTRSAVLAATAAVTLSFGGAASASTVPPNDPELEQLLLTIDDMPTGWAVDTAGTFADADDGEPDECESGEPSPLDLDATYDENPEATVTFAAGFFDYVYQGIAQFPDDDDVETVLNLVRDAFEQCPTTINADGSSMTLSEMSFPDFGDDSVAVRGITDSFPIPVIFILIGIDDRLMLLMATGEGADVQLVEELATVAVDRID